MFLRNIFYFEELITKNKALCIQIGFSKHLNLFQFNVELNRPDQDHYGFKVDIEIYKLYFYFNFYDRRHVEETED